MLNWFVLKSYFYGVKIVEKYISRCIQLAKNGLGSTFPNPMVGCVIVHDDLIIGEGFTSPYGGNHAEVNAINSVKNKALLSKSTLYVTLEPCSHYGKTPPCSDLIIKWKIPHVVIGTSDSNTKVAGRGIQKLKDAGCRVTIGVLQKECQEHHRRFLTFHEEKRPYIILKWAETLDGFMAPEEKKRSKKAQPYWITNTYSRQMVHKWRAEEQAILVGSNTVLQDNPRLNVRAWKGKSPIRVIIDKELKIKGSYYIFDQTIKTIIITQQKDLSLREKGIHYELIDFSGNIGHQISRVLQKHDIISVLIEGGLQTIQTFIEANLWDEARVFKGSITFSNGLKAPRLSNKIDHIRKIESDTLTVYTND